MKRIFLLNIQCLIAIFISTSVVMAGGWCGQSKKEDCGNWVVQMAVFNGGAMGGNDCVSYNGCVTYAKWDWSYTGAWSQLLLEKQGFCGKNYRVGNTKDFKVRYKAKFTHASGNHRVAIVSWAKTADNCNWSTNNLYELYLHEKSFNEGSHKDAYDSWCIYKGKSPSCSGSRYHLYDCEYQILGRSLRCWRINSRTSGTTDVDCLWEAWRSKGIAPNVYYYFTEVGAEVGPNSIGRFEIENNAMWRVKNGRFADDEFESEVEDDITLSVYPNPASNVLNIKGNDLSSVSIYGLSGQLVLQQQIINYDNQLDISRLKSGMYYVRIADNLGAITTKKIVVQ